MGQFTFMVKESCWREVYSKYDDEKLLQLAKEKLESGLDTDDVEDFVYDYLRDSCWNDIEYGDADNYEDDDTDFDIGDRDSLGNTVRKIVNQAEEELSEQCLGSIDDDSD